MTSRVELLGRPVAPKTDHLDGLYLPSPPVGEGRDLMRPHLRLEMLRRPTVVAPDEELEVKYSEPANSWLKAWAVGWFT